MTHFSKQPEHVHAKNGLPLETTASGHLEALAPAAHTRRPQQLQCLTLLPPLCPCGTSPHLSASGLKASTTWGSPGTPSSLILHPEPRPGRNHSDLGVEVEEAVCQEQAGLDPGPSGCPCFHTSTHLSRAICSLRPHGAASGLENKQNAKIQNKQKKNPTRLYGTIIDQDPGSNSLVQTWLWEQKEMAKEAASKCFV